KCMKPNTRLRTSRESQNGGETCQKFQINDRVDANFSDSVHCSQRIKRQSERTVYRNRYHILLGNDVHCVENESIVLKYDEINVFASDHVDRTTNCRISENGRALLRELNEKNPPNFARPW